MECNTLECGFDGGDCIIMPASGPWDQCPYGDVCRERFLNGRCDVECNSVGCLYDGLECAPPCQVELWCTARVQDGVCQPECNTAECSYDIIDCNKKTQDSFVSLVFI